MKNLVDIENNKCVFKNTYEIIYALDGKNNPWFKG